MLRKIFQMIMKPNFQPTGEAPKEGDQQRSTFEIVSSGINTGIMYGTGSAVIGSAIGGPIGAVVGTVVGAVIGGYIGSHKVNNP